MFDSEHDEAEHPSSSDQTCVIGGCCQVNLEASGEGETMKHNSGSPIWAAHSRVWGFVRVRNITTWESKQSGSYLIWNSDDRVVNCKNLAFTWQTIVCVVRLFHRRTNVSLNVPTRTKQQPVALQRTHSDQLVSTEEQVSSSLSHSLRSDLNCCWYKGSNRPSPWERRLTVTSIYILLHLLPWRRNWDRREGKRRWGGRKRILVAAFKREDCLYDTE